MNYIKNNKLLSIIILLSFIVPLCYSLYFRIEPRIDARAYDIIGWNLSQGNGYRESLAGPIERDYAVTRVGPLYQFTLAGIYSIFGHNYEPVWMFNALMHAASVWLIYLICLLIFKENENKKKIGLSAAAIFAFYPDLIELSAMLLIETFYLFLFILALYIFFKYFNNQKLWSAALIGIFFGLATLARPPVLFLIPVILFYFYTRKNWQQLAVFIVMIIIVFTPWTVRNYLMYERVAPFGVAGAFNFWIGNYHGANGEQEPPPEAWAYAREYGIIEVQAEAVRQFKGFLYNHPGEFIKLTALRVNKYFSIARPMGWWFHHQALGEVIVVASSALASIVLFIFGIAGFIRAWTEKNKKLKYLLAFTVITPLIIFITVIETRYRVQIYPLLCIFAGYFIIDLWLKKKIWQNKILWIAIAVIFANGLIDILLNLERISKRLDLLF